MTHHIYTVGTPSRILGGNVREKAHQNIQNIANMAENSDPSLTQVTQMNNKLKNKLIKTSLLLPAVEVDQPSHDPNNPNNPGHPGQNQNDQGGRKNSSHPSHREQEVSFYDEGSQDSRTDEARGSAMPDVVGSPGQ